MRNGTINSKAVHVRCRVAIVTVESRQLAAWLRGGGCGGGGVVVVVGFASVDTVVVF